MVAVGPTQTPEWPGQPHPGQGGLQFLRRTGCEILIEAVPVPAHAEASHHIACFGTKDAAVDPVQGSSAYTDALTRAGNPNFEVHLIEGVGHIMKPMNAGCLSEAAIGAFSAENLDLMEAFLSRMVEA